MRKVEAQFIVRDWVNKVDYDIGLSYRPVRLNSLGEGFTTLKIENKIFLIYKEIQKGAKSYLTINVPLFKKLRDIIFFWWENHCAALGTI